jgi:hypothetical protein
MCRLVAIGAGAAETCQHLLDVAVSFDQLIEMFVG